MFEYLKPYRVICVTGPQRSGTTIATQMIAHDTGHQVILEEEFGVTDKTQWDNLVRHGQNIVIQCPTMMRFITEAGALNDVAVVIMRRDLDAIHASMARIGWYGSEGESYERELYEYPEGDIAAYKHKYFDSHQWYKILHCYEIRYGDLANHPLWIPADQRGHFQPRQTAYPSRALIITLAYRQYGRAIQSHLAAARVYGRRFDWLYLYGNPADLPPDADTHDLVTRKYQEAQRVFLQGDYDTFISIEDDMVIPPDTFSRLQSVLNNGADIAYGLYCWRHSRNGGGWCAYTQMQGDEGSSILTDLDTARQAFREQRVIDTVGVGMGCIAIKRHVLQAISFSRQGQHCNDWYLATDAQKHGYLSRCDMGLVCGHISMNPSPRILWPDIQDETYQRVDYL